MIACVDGGLFCIGVPVLITIMGPTLVVWFRQKFKWCKKACGCKCHHGNVTGQESQPSLENSGNDK